MTRCGTESRHRRIAATIYRSKNLFAGAPVGTANQIATNLICVLIWCDISPLT